MYVAFRPLAHLLPYQKPQDGKRSSVLHTTDGDYEVSRRTEGIWGGVGTTEASIDLLVLC